MGARRWLAALLVAVLLMIPGLGVLAEGADGDADGGAAESASAGSAGETPGTLPLTAEARASAQWLQENLPAPQPGNELPVLALLRAGVLAPGDEYLAGYFEALRAQAEGDPAAQGLEACGWQALVLAATGADVNAEAPALAGAFTDTETVVAAGPGAMRLALLVFGPGGVEPPAALDLDEVARRLAGLRNLDGGFGREEGVSDAVTSAQALQALAFYRHDGTVENAVVDLREWLRGAQADFGGFTTEDGAPSALATAECAIALSCLSEEKLQEGTPPPVEALMVFHNEDGGFLPDPGSAPEVELTAVGLLALVGDIRMGFSLVPVYNMGDAAVQTAEDEGFVKTEAPISIPGLPPLSNGVMIAILVGVVAFIVLLAALVSTGKDMRERKKRRERIEKLRASGKIPADLVIDDDDDFILDIDYEYVGDEAGLKPGDTDGETDPPPEP